MKSVGTILIAITCFISCAQSQNSEVKLKQPVKEAPSPNEGVATFSEGCFWHSEIIFQSLVGVRDAVSGYAGGHTTDPTYESVASGETGHAESVQVYYDPSKITYETLVSAFFASMDPTELNRQGNDAGTEYRSIAFYRNDKEKKTIEAEIKRITDIKKYRNKIVTQVVPFTKFYPAEAYHQEYAYSHTDEGYVHNVTLPDYYRFRKEFKGNFKQ